MKEKYRDYVIAFNNLDIEDKRREVIENLERLIKLFHKVNIDFNEPTNILPVLKNANNEEEYLTKLFSYILTLKEVSAKTIDIILNNMYEDVD